MKVKWHISQFKMLTTCKEVIKQSSIPTSFHFNGKAMVFQGEGCQPRHYSPCDQNYDRNY